MFIIVVSTQRETIRFERFLGIKKDEKHLTTFKNFWHWIENSRNANMATTISPGAIEDIRKLIDDACDNEQPCLPCASVVVVCKGNDLPTLTHSSSMMEKTPRVLHHEKNTDETTSRVRADDDKIHWLASCTKLVTGIACMQLVEQGNLRLDDSDQVETFCPELAAVKVLREDGSLVKKENRITLRMLLTHTGKHNIGHKI